MKKIIIITGMLLSTSIWANYELGLTCTNKESSKDLSFVDRKILLDLENEKVRYFHVETYESQIMRPRDKVYDLSKQVESYNWDSLDLSEYKGQIRDSAGNYTQALIRWVSRANYMSYKLNRETLLLKLDSNLGIDKEIPCELSTADAVLSEIEKILKQKELEEELKLKEEMKQQQEQLKKNKI